MISIASHWLQQATCLAKTAQCCIRHMLHRSFNMCWMSLHESSAALGSTNNDCHISCTRSYTGSTFLSELVLQALVHRSAWQAEPMVYLVVSVALLVVHWTNNRKAVGSMPVNVVCITVLTGNRLGWTVRCGRPPLLLPSCKKLEFKTVSVWWTLIWHG